MADRWRMHNRRVVLAVFAGSMLVTGCSSSSPSSSSPSAQASTGALASVSPTAASAQTAPTDPTPGVRQGPLRSADLLVVAPDTLSQRTVSAVRKLTGVTELSQASLANVSVEDQQLRVLSVDVERYRNFTPAASADNQALWERVAAGEIALDPSLQNDIRLTDQGTVGLGPAPDDPHVHVGAWAPQVPGAVDAVLNRGWGERLAMATNNALLITTAETAPDRVVEPLQRLLGDEVSVQRLDAVATYGLDVDAVQTAVVVGTVAQAVGRYSYRVDSSGKVTPDPAWVRAHITTEQVPILGAVTCNKALFGQLRAALSEVVARGLSDKIHPGEYAGCYYPRFIAGKKVLSNHAFGLALDLNVPGNGRGSVGAIDREVVAIFKRWGFGWGGDWRWTDPMHFEMNRVVHPGSGPTH